MDPSHWLSKTMIEQHLTWNVQDIARYYGCNPQPTPFISVFDDEGLTRLQLNGMPYLLTYV